MNFGIRRRLSRVLSTHLQPGSRNNIKWVGFTALYQNYFSSYIINCDRYKSVSIGSYLSFLNIVNIDVHQCQNWITLKTLVAAAVSSDLRCQERPSGRASNPSKSIFCQHSLLCARISGAWHQALNVFKGRTFITLMLSM